MSGWGIGLGSFVTGMQQGYGLGQRMRHDREASAINEMKMQDLQRTQQQKAELDALGRQGKAGFDAAVSSGQADPNHPDEWFSQNYAPKMESFFLSKGDVESAAKWNKWSSDATTKKQIKSMGQVIGQLYDGANTGDYSGLNDEMGKFFKTLPKDMRDRMGSFDGLQASTDQNGQFAASATFTDKKGESHTYTWTSPDQLRQTIEGWANPSALFSETMKDAAAAKKFGADLKEYKLKKDIDIRADETRQARGLKGKTPQERYAAAQDVLTKASIDGKPPTDADVRAFLKQQDDYAATSSPGIGVPAQPAAPDVSTEPTEVAAQPAAAVAPGKKIIVNQKTGEPVNGTAGAAPMLASPASVTAPPPSSTASSTASSAPAAPPPTASQGVAAGIGLPALLASRAARQVAPTAPAQQATAPGIGGAPTPATAVAGGKGQPLYVATPQAPTGLVKQGNIDLSRRPVVKNADGSISTVRSITVTLPDGKAVLIPTVIGNRVVSNQEAIQHFKQSGENLGVFQDEGSADQYANALHEQQAQAYLPKGR